MQTRIVHYHQVSEDVLTEIISDWSDAERAATAAAVLEFGCDGDDVLLGYEGDELVSVALLALDKREPAGLPAGDYVTVEYLATKRPGFGRDTMKAILDFAESAAFRVVLVALLSAVSFYQHIGMMQLAGTRYFYA